MIRVIGDCLVTFAAIVAILDYFGIKPNEPRRGIRMPLTRNWKLVFMLALTLASLGMCAYSFYRSFQPKIREKYVDRVVEKEKVIPANCPKTDIAKPGGATRKEGATTKPKQLDTTIRQEGNGNSANPGTITAPITQGPCGVVQSGGSGNVASPNCAPPERHLTDTQKKAIRDALKGKQIIVHVGYLVNVPDAENYAGELCDAFQEGVPAIDCSSLWAMTNEGRGSPWYGVEFVYKGDPIPEGQTTSSAPESPVGILIGALVAAGLNRGVGHADPAMKDNEVTLIVGPPPKD